MLTSQSMDGKITKIKSTLKIFLKLLPISNTDKENEVEHKKLRDQYLEMQKKVDVSDVIGEIEGFLSNQSHK
jgi:hypothetical protein